MMGLEIQHICRVPSWEGRIGSFNKQWLLRMLAKPPAETYIQNIWSFKEKVSLFSHQPHDPS